MISYSEYTGLMHTCPGVNDGKNPQQTGKKSADTQGVCRYYHGSLKVGLLHGRRPWHIWKNS